jgi:TIR domain
MTQLFISHSSRNNAEALALSQWLTQEGWDDQFLDLDPQRGITAGERWEKALHQAAGRCDAVLFLISPDWLASEWCRREFTIAQQLGKRLFVLLIGAARADIPAHIKQSWQVVDLAGGDDHGAAREVRLHGETQPRFVYFSRSGLARLREGLKKAGLDPESFPWPPADQPNRPPYCGLRPLEAEDAGIFFGREAPIIEMLAQLRGLRDAAPPRFLAILGASGAMNATT